MDHHALNGKILHISKKNKGKEKCFSVGPLDDECDLSASQLDTELSKTVQLENSLIRGTLLAPRSNFLKLKGRKHKISYHFISVSCQPPVVDFN